MKTQVVLEIEDTLYRRAEALERTSQRPVTTILAEAIVLDEPEELSRQWPDEDELDDVMDREIAAFQALHAELYQSYPGQYVAIYGQQFVDHDPELASLYLRIRQKYPDEFVLIRQVEADSEPVSYFRSPRLIQSN